MNIEDERLRIRELFRADSAFINDLLNQPSFIQNIGDRGVRSDEQAADFIENRYRASYSANGYGLWAVELNESQTPIGICGFVKRDYFEFPDIGFAFLPEFEGKGYAFEAAKACLNHGRDALNFTKVLAITTQTNARSERLLLKLGFAFNELITNPEGETLKQFSIDL